MFFCSFNFFIMKSQETELRFLYLAIDLIIMNIAILFVLSIYYNFNQLNIPDKSIYLLLLNLSEVITYSVFSKRNLYLHDYFSNRVLRITNRTLIFLIIAFILAQLILPGNFSHLFLLECAALYYVGKLVSIIFYIAI